MRRVASVSALLVSLALAPAALAVTQNGWSFAGQTDPSWEAQGLASAQQGAEGLTISVGPQGGGLTRAIEPGTRVEAVMLRIRSATNAQGFIVWRAAGWESGRMAEFPFTVEASDTFQEHILPVSSHPQWSKSIDYLGVGFAPGSTVEIADAGIASWGMGEKAVELVKGFWTFDEFKPLSINFLWGPLLSTTPALRAQLYDTLPPQAPSATRVMYAVLAIVGALALVTRAVKPERSAAAFGLCTLVFAGLWILFDVRMGSEILSYAAHDLRHYVLAPTGKKELRTHRKMYDILNQTLPVLQQEERFALVTQENAFYSLVRYRSYPTLPITPDRSQSGLTLWLVAYRQDAVIDEQQRLTVGGRVLSGPGKVVQHFGSGEYLFSTKP